MTYNLSERLRRAAAELAAIASDVDVDKPSSDDGTARAEQIVMSYLTCLDKGDLDGLGEFVHHDISYRVPGRSRVAGLYEGLDGLRVAMTIMPRTGVTDLRSHMTEVVTSRPNHTVLVNGHADDVRVVTFHELCGTTDGSQFGLEFAMRFTVRNGRIASIAEYSADQYATDDAFA